MSEYGVEITEHDVYLGPGVGRDAEDGMVVEGDADCFGQESLEFSGITAGDAQEPITYGCGAVGEVLDKAENPHVLHDEPF